MHIKKAFPQNEKYIFNEFQLLA